MRWLSQMELGEVDEELRLMRIRLVRVNSLNPAVRDRGSARAAVGCNDCHHHPDYDTHLSKPSCMVEAGKLNAEKPLSINFWVREQGFYR